MGANLANERPAFAIVDVASISPRDRRKNIRATIRSP